MVRLSSENIFLKDTFHSFHPGLELPILEKIGLLWKRNLQDKEKFPEIPWETTFDSTG